MVQESTGRSRTSDVSQRQETIFALSQWTCRIVFTLGTKVYNIPFENVCGSQNKELYRVVVALNVDFGDLYLMNEIVASTAER
jgi:hypothetical protein